MSTVIFSELFYYFCIIHWQKSDGKCKGLKSQPVFLFEYLLARFGAFSVSASEARLVSRAQLNPWALTVIEAHACDRPHAWPSPHDDDALYFTDGSTEKKTLHDPKGPSERGIMGTPRREPNFPGSFRAAAEWLSVLCVRNRFRSPC